MTIRHLDRLFSPASMAVIGASPRQGSIGRALVDNLGDFERELWLVNPRYRRIGERRVYHSLDELPGVPDLAVIATPAETVVGLIAALGERGTRAAVVISTGFAERGAEGRARQQALLDAARPHLLRIIGPNCLGIVVPSLALNATFAHAAPAAGRLAFVTQSGAIVTSLIDWARDQQIGFSHLVSLGDMADVDFGDMLDYLANDAATGAILLYIESITHARKFVSAARAAARNKPVIVVKAGRHPEGARAASSHTGALAGSDTVYDAVFRRAGVLRVMGLEELFDAAEALGVRHHRCGDRVAIVTNGGGIGVLAADALIDLGGRLAELSTATLEQLDRVLPPNWSRANPVDLMGDAEAGRYVRALEVLRDAPEVDAVVVLHCPTAIVSSIDIARAVAECAGGRNETPIVTSWVGGPIGAAADRLFASHGIENYPTPDRAMRALMYLLDYQRVQALLMETPPSTPEDFTPATATAATIVHQARQAGRQWLKPAEARALLECYRIPLIEQHAVQTPEEAARCAAMLGVPVALKILSADALHKSDVGGVMLDLRGADTVREAAVAMQVRIAREHPRLSLEGFLIEPMIDRQRGHELIIGLSCDPQFGPVILFGHGGTAVEVVADRAVGLPPLNMQLARDLMSGTRVYRLLQGYRERPAVDLQAVALSLVKVSQLAIDLEIEELDINPLMADEHGVLGLDVRVRLTAGPREGGPTARHSTLSEGAGAIRRAV